MLVGLAGIVVAAAVGFAVFEPVQVLPRVRVAPGFGVVDQSGAAYTSEDGRGNVTVYAFAPTTCGDQCAALHDTMRSVRRRVVAEVDLGGAGFRMITVALDTAEPAALAAAAAASGADGEVWRWVGADQQVLGDVVGSGFRVFFDASDPAAVAFDPVFVIVDGAGVVRGEYRYASLVAEADRLTRHISLLGDELRHSTGAASFLYEAAHVFMCYP